jgi:hypothetical protein
MSYYSYSAEIKIIIEEDMWVQVDYDLDIVVGDPDWAYEDTTYVDGCAELTCGTVNYDVTLTRSYTFTQTNGISIPSGTSTIVKDPKVV